MPDAALSQISAAITLTDTDLEANTDTIRILLEQCITVMGEDNPMVPTLQSVLLLLDTGTADAASVSVLLKSVVDSAGELPGDDVDAAAAQTEAPAADPGAQVQETDAQDDGGQVQAPVAEQTEESAPQEDLIPMAAQRQPNGLGLPAFEVSTFLKAILQGQVLLNVPSDWGNNASGRSLTSFSPVNDSGAISPAAGTLTISYFAMEDPDEKTALETYARNIENMSVTSNMTVEPATAANLSGQKMSFLMTVGANQFTCETFCFAYERTIYAIELMQGPQSSYDYFPVYDNVVDSAEVGDEEEIREAEEQSEAGIPVQMTEKEIPPETDAPLIEETEGPVVQETEAPVTQETDAPLIEETEAPVTQETDAPLIEETEAPVIPETETPVVPALEGTATGDIGTFQYSLNGHDYQFPTPVAELAPEDLALNRDLMLPYDFSSDADMAGGTWTEIVNTQYYYFESSQYKEMAGVTNMEGYPVTMSEGMLTALIDTQGDYVDITLPGDVKVGGAETDILRGFPQFAGMPMDGTAVFIGNELLYACNVRDDGCNGYVLVRNDEPYYSAVSIICDNGVICEISFECLGSVRAYGVFL